MKRASTIRVDRPALEAMLSECWAETLAQCTGVPPELDLVLESGLPEMGGGRAQLRQMLGTALRVACAAMSQGGTLSVRVRGRSGGVAPEGVRLLIRDTGPGYDAEAIARIARVGAGLPRSKAERELRAVRVAAQQLGGLMHLVSARGCGTSVVIDLPAAGAKPAGGAPAAGERAAVLSLPRGAA